MFKYVVLLHLLVPGEQEAIKQIGPDYNTAAACNAAYLAQEFSIDKPDTHRYECVLLNAEGRLVRNALAPSVFVIRPPILGGNPDIIIQSR